MKNKKKIRQFLLLVFAVLFIAGGYSQKAEAKTKVKKATITLDKKTGIFTVKYNGAVIATTPYKKETVYAYTDIYYERLGPSTEFSKVKKLKKDMGEKLVRVGNVKGNWSIVEVKGKYYFIGNTHISTTSPKNKLTTKKYTSRQLRRRGVIRWHGWRFTWYSQRVLKGKNLHIPGRHVDKSGYVCDKYGYICLASGKLRKGTVVKTPFGKKGKVYDSGCGKKTLDVYTNF